jgi:hypothetical protein
MSCCPRLPSLLPLALLPHLQLTSVPLPPFPAQKNNQDCLAGIMLGRRSQAMDPEKRAAATVKAVMKKLFVGGLGGCGPAALAVTDCWAAWPQS